MASEVKPRSRGLLCGLLLAWALFACFFAGCVAALSRMPTLWGGSSRFFEYAVPLPLTWGMMHIPSLALFGYLLARAYQDPGRWRPLVQLFCLGTLIGAAMVLVLSEALRDFPLLLYLIIDAFTALLANGLIPLRADTHFQVVSTRTRKVLLAGPALAVLAAVTLGPLLLPRYHFVMSDTEELGMGHDVVRFWFRTRRAAGEAAAECPRLAALVDKGYRKRYEQRDGKRHRMFLLFKPDEDIGRNTARSAWVSYTWWPDGRELCSADRHFQRSR